jgi:hypothetical protein
MSVSNDYEERKAARIERMRARADKARAESEARLSQASQMASAIPFGQPILVGHHSEKRHRRDLERIDNHHRKAVEASQKAEHYERKAQAAENNTAISSDDPDAVAKLTEKLAALEAHQKQLKAENRACRKAKVTLETADKAEALRAAGVSEAGIRSLIRLAQICPHHCKPYLKHPSYELSNNNANIKRVRDRIKSLEARIEAVAAEPIEGDGFTISEDTDWGRILIEFDRKPCQAARDYLKSHGWRWARSRLAWVRHLNTNGRTYAQWAAEKLPELLKG